MESSRYRWIDVDMQTAVDSRDFDLKIDVKLIINGIDIIRPYDFWKGRNDLVID